MNILVTLWDRFDKEKFIWVPIGKKSVKKKRKKRWWEKK
jgi:hypothetical protein